MELGPSTSFLVEFLSHIDVDGRVIVLADLAELGHDYKAGDMLKAYKELSAICESWEAEEIDDFKSNLYDFIQEQYIKIRSEIGHKAMETVCPIAEAEDDDETSKKNKEEFEKGAEKQKKKEQSPIAKAVRSKGQDQDDMAKSIGVNKSTVSRYKTGKRKPSFDVLKKIKNQYGMAVVNQLLGA